MRFERYVSTKAFGQDVLEILLENEVQNNLPISFIHNVDGSDTSDWLMAVVKDEGGAVVLTAACTPPFNLVLYETSNKPNDAAVSMLCSELKQMRFRFPGVLAPQGLSARFAEAYAGTAGYRRNVTMKVMRLDTVVKQPSAPGILRPLCREDLYFVPYWEREFSRECRLDYGDIADHVKLAEERIGQDTHYIWQDHYPVSQAMKGRSTGAGAVINGVYTPPHYRNKGYASSLVAALSQLMLERGNRYCCLYADASNPVSCSIYQKIGYIEQCVVEEHLFTRRR